MNASYRSPPLKSDAAPAPKPEPTPRERLARAKVLARRALAYWKMSSVLFTIGCVIALLVAINVKRIYRSECVVLVKAAMKTDERDPGIDKKLAVKLKDTLLTRGRLEPIIKEFGLYGKIVDGKSMVDAVQEMKPHIGFRGRESDTFVISFEDDDAERTRAITQRLADTMIDDFLNNNLTGAKQRASFLESEESRAEQEVESANKALATFLTEHPEFANTTNPTGVHGVPTAATLPAAAGGDALIGALLHRQALLEAEIKAASSGPQTAHPNEGLTELLKLRDDAAKKVAAAQTDLADKRARYTDQHPDVIAAKAQTDAAATSLRVAEQQLAAANERTPTPEPAQVPPELQKKLDDITQQIAARRSEIARRANQPAAAATADAAPPPEPSNPYVELETEWARLLRLTGEAKGKLGDAQRRNDRARLDVSAAEAYGDTQMVVIEPAFKPTRPARGGRTNAALTGLGVAAFVALAYAFGRVLTNDTIIDAADVEALNVIPVLGIIPRLPPLAPLAVGGSTDVQPHGGGARAP